MNYPNEFNPIPQQPEEQPTPPAQQPAPVPAALLRLVHRRRQFRAQPAARFCPALQSEHPAILI